MSRQVSGPSCQQLEIAGLPGVLGRVGLAPIEQVQHESAAVAAAGGADLPEIQGSHAPVVGTGAAPLGTMEDRLAPP